jgi:phosphohistidine phosphatase SixA
MKLYLVQHGEAKTKEESPDRPLTDEGKDASEKKQPALLLNRLRFLLILFFTVAKPGLVIRQK